MHCSIEQISKCAEAAGRQTYKYWNGGRQGRAHEDGMELGVKSLGLWFLK